MHCHLIVSRKDQSNKVKISPLTNHRNTRKGVITGGFDRTILFENVEKGFDKLFGYNRQLPETFEYCNTMKNGTVTDKLRMQERELNTPEKDIVSGKKEDLQIGRYADKQAGMIENKFSNKQESNIEDNHIINQENKQSFNQSDLGLSSVFSILPPAVDISSGDEPEAKPVKKKKPRQRLN
jgi:hypothetical protein